MITHKQLLLARLTAGIAQVAVDEGGDREELARYITEINEALDPCTGIDVVECEPFPPLKSVK